MATYVTDQGICLRVTDFSETSQIVGMFTRGHGLVPLIAKGAKRASKKNVMSGPLDLLTSGEVVFVPAREAPGGGRGGGGAQLGTLAEWQLDDHRRELRGNLPALNAAVICAEVTTHLLQPLDPHPELFDELQAALEILGYLPAHLFRGLVAFVKAALTSAGYWPRLDACLVCGKAVADAPMRFDPRAGGIMCATCPSGGSGVTMIVPGKVALALARLPLPAALKANPPERAADEAALHLALQVLLTQVETITDKPLRTRGLVGTIFRQAATAGRST